MTDEELLKQDKAELRKQLNSESVILYKLCKMITRSTHDDKLNSHVGKNKEDFQVLTQLFNKLNKDQDLSPSEYLSFASSFKDVHDFVEKTDEDIFPSFFESLKAAGNTKHNFTTGKAKDIQDSQDHALMSLFVKFGGGFSGSASFYECSQIETDKLPDAKARFYFRLYKGFVLLENDLKYLAEKEFTDNIAELKKDKSLDFREVNIVFNKEQFNKEQSMKLALMVNYLLRGIDRSKMEREIDHERSLEDFEQGIKLAHELGVQDEFIWPIEAFLYIDKGENKKAIATLKKLEKSKMLNEDEKEVVRTAIKALEKGDSEAAVSDGAFDAEFVSGLVSEIGFGRFTDKAEDKVTSSKQYSYIKKKTEGMTRFISIPGGSNEPADSKDTNKDEESYWDKAKNLVN
jgi:hypothetical protein